MDKTANIIIKILVIISISFSNEAETLFFSNQVLFHVYIGFGVIEMVNKWNGNLTKESYESIDRVHS